MIKSIYEIFAEFEQVTKHRDRCNILKFNETPALKQVLQGAFHPAIQYIFKQRLSWKRSGAPPGLGYSNMTAALDRVYIFVEGSRRVNKNLPYSRREDLAIQQLEAMEALEADVFMNMMLKNLNIKGLTYDFVRQLYPDLNLPEPSTQKVDLRTFPIPVNVVT